LPVFSPKSNQVPVAQSKKKRHKKLSNNNNINNVTSFINKPVTLKAPLSPSSSVSSRAVDRRKKSVCGKVSLNGPLFYMSIVRNIWQ